MSQIFGPYPDITHSPLHIAFSKHLESIDLAKLLYSSRARSFRPENDYKGLHNLLEFSEGFASDIQHKSL
jgi:hypothetical protein